MPRTQKREALDELKGWEQIAAFLANRCRSTNAGAESGMPIEKRGRFVYSSREQLNRWLGRKSAGEPVQIATAETDLGSELKRGLSYIRKQMGRRYGVVGYREKWVEDDFPVLRLTELQDLLTNSVSCGITWAHNWRQDPRCSIVKACYTQIRK